MRGSEVRVLMGSPFFPNFDGIATYLASERRVAGLVLISPYTSIANVAAHQYPIFPVHFLIRNPFPAF